MRCTSSLPGTLVAGTVALALTACAPRAARPAGLESASPTWDARRAALERRLHVAQLLLAKAQTELELGELRYRDQIARAEMEFELAKRRQQGFTRFIAPQRLARAELNMQQAEHGVLEARQALQQAEGGELAERRLAHLKRDLELRRDELKTLQEVTLPLEQSELDLAAEVRKRAVLQTQRDNEGALIDRQVAVLTAEAEVARLEGALSELPE